MARVDGRVTSIHKTNTERSCVVRVHVSAGGKHKHSSKGKQEPAQRALTRTFRARVPGAMLINKPKTLSKLGKGERMKTLNNMREGASARGGED